MSTLQNLDPVAGTFLPAVEPGETVIERRRGWRALNVAEVWSYRELLFFLAWRDVKVRYKQTALGAAWAILQPVLMMVAFTLLFKGLAEVDTGAIPYPLFVYIGLLPWTFFANSLGSASMSVVESERLITKVYFPRLLIPFSSVGAAMVDFAVGSIFLVGLLAVYGIFPVWTWTLVPLFLLGFMLAALGAGTLLSALNVNYRDFRYVIPFLIQFWMITTPSIFLDLTKSSMSPETLALLRCNPLTGLIAGFRACLLGTAIAWGDVAWGFGLVAVLFVAGCYVFRRMEASFSDVI